MKIIKVVCGVVVAGLFFCAAGVSSGGEDVQGQILSLARDGKNIEAIALFEKLSKATEAPTDVLRAAAGCYWRESRFEKARGLYQQVLERQPNLRSVSSDKEGDLSLLAHGDEALAAVETVKMATPVEVVTPVEKAIPVEAAAPVEAGVPDAPASPGEVPADKAADDLKQELAVLKAAYKELEEGREQWRRAADARIAELSAETEARVNEIGALHAQLATGAGSPGANMEALRQQITEQTQALDTARIAYETQRVQSEQKINVLLDAVTEESKRRKQSEEELKKLTDTYEARVLTAAKEHAELEQQVQLSKEQVEQMRQRSTADAQAARERETALLARIDEIRAGGGMTDERVVAMAANLQEMRRQVDEVSALLAVRNTELAHHLDGLRQGAMELALAEIERLDLEHAELEADAVRRQAALQEQIMALEEAGAGAAKVLAETEHARAEEREKRVALEALTAQQADELQRTRKMLEEATAEFSRQYSAIREQVQSGVTVRIKDGEGGVTNNREIVSSADLAPFIGKLEEATTAATVEVQQLRRQLEEERATFATSAAESEKKQIALKAEIGALTKRLDEATVSATAHSSEMVTVQEQALKAMTTEQDLRITDLKGEMEKMRVALATRDRDLKILESDLKVERESSTHVLAMARANEASLRQRVRELEALLEQFDAGKTGTTTNSAAPVAAVLASGEVREILNLLPTDPPGAILRFEALSPDVSVPVELLNAVGNLYREQGRYEAALAVFEKSLAQAPDDLNTSRKVVMTLFDMGRYDQVLDRLAGPKTTLKKEQE